VYFFVDTHNSIRCAPLQKDLYVFSAACTQADGTAQSPLPSYFRRDSAAGNNLSVSCGQKGVRDYNRQK
jgi:hypothetical protein